MPSEGPSHNRRHDIDAAAEQITQRHLGGESVKALADAFGASRNVIVRVLRDAGTQPRGLGDANRIMAAARTPEQRSAYAEAAHAAVRGTQQSPLHRQRIAASIEAKGSYGSRGEAMLAGWLLDLGREVVPQKAIGPYNCDLATGSVAVEVWTGNWHLSGRHAARTAHRVRHILDAGWMLVIVWTDARRSPLEPGVADHLVTLADLAERDPAARGQYRVIGGAGEPRAFTQAQLDHLALEPSGG